jgi:hypothetical protein
MTSPCFPSNNLYKAVQENEISTHQVCVRYDGIGPAPLVRTLSMPPVYNIEQLISLIRSFHFVEHVLHHDSGNIIVWIRICETREEETNSIGIIRFPDSATTPLTISHADEIMRTGIYSNVFMVNRIVRANTHSHHDFSREQMYCAYIIYLRTITTEEGEVPGGAW